MTLDVVREVIERFIWKVKGQAKLARREAKDDWPSWLPQPKTWEERERELYETLTRDLEDDLGLEEGELQPAVEKTLRD